MIKKGLLSVIFIMLFLTILDIVTASKGRYDFCNRNRIGDLKLQMMIKDGVGKTEGEQRFSRLSECHKAIETYSFKRHIILKRMNRFGLYLYSDTKWEDIAPLLLEHHIDTTGLHPDSSFTVYNSDSTISYSRYKTRGIVFGNSLVYDSEKE